MAGISSIPRIFKRFISNGGDPEWWYQRVFVTHMLGRLVRTLPDAPGYDSATSVMNEDWDTLILLDACRADYFEDMINTDQFDEYNRVISQGSHSSEWTRRNFQGKKFGDTVYVTGNLHTKIIADDSFHEIIEIRDGYDSDTHPNASPQRIAAAARKAHKEYPQKRLIIHFMQPHSPLYDKPIEWDKKLSTEEWWDAYRDSLDEVFDIALELHEEFDGKTVITADHGETHNRRLFGLFKISNHPPKIRIPELVEVPWAVLPGERRTINKGSVNRFEPDDNVEQSLRELGYLPPAESG